VSAGVPVTGVVSAGVLDGDDKSPVAVGETAPVGDVSPLLQAEEISTQNVTNNSHRNVHLLSNIVQIILSPSAKDKLDKGPVITGKPAKHIRPKMARFSDKNR
jgi:hypothetical protein